MKHGATRSPGVHHRKKKLSPGLSWLIPIALLGLIILACNLPGISKLTSPGAKPGTSSQPDDLSSFVKDMSLEEALVEQAEDNRPQVLKQMGPPDVFRITFAAINGQPVRQEEWSYFDDTTRFDFVDGALVWTVTLEAMPDAYLNASQYDPLNFTAGMSLADVQTLLADQELVQVDMAETGVTGGLVVAGDRILLCFDQGGLVSVETFALSPEVSS